MFDHSASSTRFHRVQIVVGNYFLASPYCARTGRLLKMLWKFAERSGDPGDEINLKYVVWQVPVETFFGIVYERVLSPLQAFKRISRCTRVITLFIAVDRATS